MVIFPPLKLAKRLSERVRTLDALWTVKRLLAGTFLLHLRGRGGVSACILGAVLVLRHCNPRSP